MEGTTSILHTALTIFLLVGGFTAAVLLYLSQRRDPPNRKQLTSEIIERSWHTVRVVILLSVLFLLYLFAGCSGQFFYEEQLPLVRLIITLCIYALLTMLIGFINRRNGGNWADSLGMGFSNIRKLVLSPAIYLAVIPFIMLASKGYHLLLEKFQGSEVQLQEVAQVVSGNLSWLEILYILTAIFIAPIYEELMFRGIIFPYVAKRAGLAPGVLIVSVLFALIHFHLPSFVPLLMLSATLCLAYWRTGSLWTSIGVHMIFNAVSILALNVAG